MSVDTNASSEFVPATSRTTTLDRLVLEHPLWKNPRQVTGLDTKSLKELGESLMDRGQIVPLEVVRVWGPTTDVVDEETGEVTSQGERPVLELVLDGQRRSLALTMVAKERKKGLSTVEVKVVDFYPEIIEMTEETSKKLYLDMVTAAIQRMSLSSFEQLEVAVRFRDEDKKTLEEVADAIARSPSWVSRMIRAYRMSSPLLLKAFRDGKVTDELFKDLAEINPHDKQEEELGNVLSGRVAGRDSKAEVRAVVKDKAAAAKKEKAAKKAEAKPAKKVKAETSAKSAAKADPKPSKMNDRITPAQADELVLLAEKKRPADPYMRGVIDGFAAHAGRKSPDEFAPPWKTWVSRSIKSGVIKPGGFGAFLIEHHAEKKKGTASTGKTAKRGKAK